jgi:hypothetical protein
MLDMEWSAQACMLPLELYIGPKTRFAASLDSKDNAHRSMLFFQCKHRIAATATNIGRAPVDP